MYCDLIISLNSECRTANFSVRDIVAIFVNSRKFPASQCYLNTVKVLPHPQVFTE